MKIQQFFERASRSVIAGVRAILLACRRATPIVLQATRRCARAIWHSPGLRATLRPAASLLRTGTIAAAVSFLCVTALRAGTETVLPTEIGVVQKDWGSGAGIVPEDIAPSKRFVIPGLATLHRLDRRIQFIRFGMHSEGNEFPSLELRTPDDLEVRVGRNGRAWARGRACARRPWKGSVEPSLRSTWSP